MNGFMLIAKFGSSLALLFFLGLMLGHLFRINHPRKHLKC